MPTAKLDLSGLAKQPSRVAFQLRCRNSAWAMALPVCCLCACDAGNGQQAQGSSSQADGQAGVVMIEARHGRRVVDSWFTEFASPLPRDPLALQHSSAPCELVYETTPASVPVMVAARATGVAQSLAQPIRWEPSIDPDDDMQLTITVSAADESGPVVKGAVQCWLDDTGRFIVPESLRYQLAQGAFSMITVVHKQNQNLADKASLSIQQMNYAD